TTLGPALGGTRLWQYATLDDAVVDALRLSRGMTYKSAVAGRGLGGGKSVIVGDPRLADREALFRAHGRFVDTLGGRYVTAADVGTGAADMALIAHETRHVSGLPGSQGDPSPVTGYGVYMAMKAAAKARWGSDSLAGKRVAVQGAGKVAWFLGRHLHEEGAALTVADVDAEKVSRFVAEYGASAVAPEAIHDVDADIHAPCALGATLHDGTIPRLRAEVVCGGANNQLAEPRHAAALEARGIFYAPDYVANGGGVINIYGELQGWSADRALEHAGGIYDTVLRVAELSRREGITTAVAADRLAEARIASVAALRRVRR
ncbi:MAG: leucine dehydrogenase, partial [Gemmatimonadales bacterium]|nr:leucine dehydrogenase [Gemmatimonadales bacterium]